MPLMKGLVRPHVAAGACSLAFLLLTLHSIPG
jgi:hypothetical protein